MKTICKPLIFCALVMSIVACDTDSNQLREDGNAITINVKSAGLLSEGSTRSEISDMDGDSKMVLLSDDDRSVALSLQVCDMPDFCSETDTRAMRYGSESGFASQTFGLYCWNTSNSNEVVYSNESVSKTDGIWVPQTSKLWYAKQTMSFEAVYPRPSQTSGSAGLTSITPSPDPAGLQFSYTVPASAGAEEDLMFACYSGTGNQGTVPLTFTHALSCVNFKTGTLSGIASINSITLSGVHKQGTCTVSVGEGNRYSYNWTPSGTANVSGSVVKTSLTSGTDLGNDYTFLVISQDLTQNAVTLKVNMTDTEGYSFDASVLLNTGKWETGKTNTYVIGSNGNGVDVTVTDRVSGNVKDNVAITNTGTAKEYVRAAIVAGWYNGDGQLVEGWTADAGFSGLPGSGWVLGSDGFYYCTSPVAAGTATATKLFESYTRQDRSAEGLHLEMTVMAQAVIYDSSKTRVKAAWGDDAAGYLN